MINGKDFTVDCNKIDRSTTIPMVIGFDKRAGLKREILTIKDAFLGIENKIGEVTVLTGQGRGDDGVRFTSFERIACNRDGRMRGRIERFNAVGVVS